MREGAQRKQGPVKDQPPQQKKAVALCYGFFCFTQKKSARKHRFLLKNAVYSVFNSDFCDFNVYLHQKGYAQESGAYKEQETRETELVFPRETEVFPRWENILRQAAQEPFEILEYMNDKQAELNRILDITVSCCTFEGCDDIPTITRDDVLGRCRKQNIVMTRSMVALNILSYGYSVTTCAMFLHRTEHSVRDMIANAQNMLVTNRAFRIANAESVLKLKENENGN